LIRLRGVLGWSFLALVLIPALVWAPWYFFLWQAEGKQVLTRIPVSIRQIPSLTNLRLPLSLVPQLIPGGFYGPPRISDQG